jgi:translation initiation factor 1
MNNISKVLKIQLDTAGRRGKPVTMITNIQHNPQVIEDLAKELKKVCGAGGTTYGKTIEVQGNHVDKAKKFFTEKGFVVK